jgi:hypothetical protein
VLRSEILAMATAAARGGRNELLLLVHPRLSESRIEKEWAAVGDALRPDVLERLSLQVVFPDGRTRHFGAHSGATSPSNGVPFAPVTEAGFRLPPRDLAFAVEKLLVWGWLTRKGRVSRKWVQDAADCSYPTVASVVGHLGSAIRRHSDRRIELTHLARAEWARFIGVSSDARCTRRYVDASRQPGTATTLLQRLQRASPTGVAVGGVAGSLHHHPKLDIVGLPRLDLSVHAPGRAADIDFIRRLDPALEPIEDPAEPAVLALHFVRHRETLFERSSHGLPWADPVECLLDLHEAGLQAQASELLEAFVQRVEA